MPKNLTPSRRKENAKEAPDQLLARWCDRQIGTRVRVRLESGERIEAVTSSRAYATKRGPFVLVSGVRGARPLEHVEVIG